MKSIIGLFTYGSKIENTVQKLHQAGIDAQQICIISNPGIISKLLGSKPSSTLQKFTLLGGALGIGVYTIFGIAAALCQCTNLQYGLAYGIGTFLGATLAGGLVGGAIGFLIGADEAEKDTHLYAQGIRLGGKVISIQVSDEEIDRVKQILALQDARGDKTLTTETA